MKKVDKYIMLLIDDEVLKNKLFQILSKYPNYTLLSYLDDFVGLQNKKNILLITNLLPSSGDNFNPLNDIRKKYSFVNILVITEPYNSFRIFESFISGANGFCLTSENIHEFMQHVYAMFKYGSTLSKSLNSMLINNLQKDSNFVKLLTDKELQIALALSTGLSYQSVADKIGMSVNGIRFYLQKIYRKLGINSKGELISLYYSNNAIY